MIFLVEFNILRPDPGLFLWTLVIFGLFWGLIGRFAFRPIAKALRTREEDIQRALDEADTARKEVAEMKAQNEVILQQAREERSAMLREANTTKNQIISEAKQKAKDEANRIIAQASTEIENKKKSALDEVQTQVGAMALSVAEDILRKELSADPAKRAYAEELASKVRLN